MTLVFGARKRAEEFSSLVEDPSTGELHDARYAEFLDIVVALRDIPEAAPRPAFVADLREQLMAAAETALLPADDDARLVLQPQHSTPRTRERRIAAAAAGLAVVGATTSMAMAAQSALPGDSLYPIKRLIEGAETGLAVTEGDKGATLLANAAGRLDEITALSRDGRLDDGAAVEQTLNDFSEQSIAASDLLLTDYAATGDESSITELRDFTGESMQILTELEAVVPEQARDELLRAARILTQIDAEALRACPACGGSGIAEIPAILTSTIESTVGDLTATTPGTVLKAVPDRKRAKQQPRQKPSGSAQQSTQQQASVPQAGGGALPPGSVLQPGAGTETEASSGGGSQPQGSSDPIRDLTGSLTNGGGSNPTSGPGAPAVPELPHLDELDEVVEDVTEPLLPNLPKLPKLPKR